MSDELSVMDRMDALERENARLTETLATFAQTLADAVSQLNRTTEIAAYAQGHLMVYESAVPTIRRVKVALDAKARKQAKAASALGMVPPSDENVDSLAEMSVIE